MNFGVKSNLYPLPNPKKKIVIPRKDDRKIMMVFFM